MIGVICLGGPHLPCCGVVLAIVKFAKEFAHNIMMSYGRRPLGRLLSSLGRKNVDTVRRSKSVIVVVVLSYSSS
jgi:hypothetical protein